MRGHTKIALALVVIGIVGMCVYRLALPWLDSQSQKNTSDSANIQGTLRIGVDGWVGYFPLCSPQMLKRMRNAGYLLECVDDNADYDTRFKKLESGNLDYAVATVDSYVLNGPKTGYPGPIVAVIDESKGGDAIVAWKDKAPSLEAIKTAQNFAVAFTPNSPSHHLLKAVASHFDVPVLRLSANAKHSDGSTEAFKFFKNKKTSIAVLWEPELSQALALPGAIKLMSTADTQGLIVDVLIAGRDQVRKQPEVVELLLKNYFKAQQYYRNDEKQLIDDIAKHYRVNEQQAQVLVKGVEWASLSDNARYWFGLNLVSGGRGEQRVLDTIESTVDVLLDAGDFQQNPIPEKDPYRLINSSPLNALWSNASFSAKGADGTTKNNFKPLSQSEWARLQSVGTLKVRPIVFASGSNDITQAGKEQLAKLGKDLQHYPHFRIEVRGHTGLRGDAQQNMVLSQKRAQAVYTYLVQNHNVSEHRARALGFGSERPLTQQPGESYRAYNYRLPRVELVLLEEEI